MARQTTTGERLAYLAGIVDGEGGKWFTGEGDNGDHRSGPSCYLCYHGRRVCHTRDHW